MYKAEEIFERKGLGGSSHGSTVTEMKDGTLISVWYSGTKEKAADVGIFMAFRKPNEDKWSVPVLIEKEGITSENPFAEDLDEGETEETSEGNPVIYADPDSDRLWLFWVTMRGAGDKSGWSACIIKVKHSDDRGKTWTNPRVIRDMIGWMIRNKPIQLSNGDTLFPIMAELGQAMSMFYRIKKSEFAKGSQECEIIEPNLFIEGGGFQPSIAEVEEGKLVCYMRASSGCVVGPYVAVSESNDFGKTWTPIHKNTSDIENPDSGTDIVYTQNGNLLLVCNPQRAGRHRLTVFLSEDKGKTWSYSRDLESDDSGKGEFSYPAIIQSRDGKIHVTHTHLRQNIKHTEFDEDWIRNGS